MEYLCCQPPPEVIQSIMCVCIYVYIYVCVCAHAYGYEMKNKDVDTNLMLGIVVCWKGKQEDTNEKKSMPSSGKNTTMFSRNNRIKKKKKVY